MEIRTNVVCPSNSDVLAMPLSTGWSWHWVFSRRDVVIPSCSYKKYGKVVWVSAHEGCLLRHCWSLNRPVSEMLATSPLAWITNSIWASFSPAPKLAKPVLQLETLLAQFQPLCLTHDCHGAQRAVTYPPWMYSRSWHDRYNMNRIHKMFRWLKFYKVCCFVFLCLGCLYIF